MFRYILFALLISLNAVLLPECKGQIGGNKPYSFLNLPLGSREAGLGGLNFTSNPGGTDAAMIASNPSFLSDSSEAMVSLQASRLYAGVSYSTLAAVLPTRNAGSWAAFVQYINYGDFDAYDPTGSPEGRFSASSYSFGAGRSFAYEYFDFGARLKIAGSNWAGMGGAALLTDFSALFSHPKNDLKLSMMIRNLGFPLKSHQGVAVDVMPLEVLAGFSIKPQKMPARLSMTFRHLQKFDIVYQDPRVLAQTDLFGNPIHKPLGFGAKALAHLVVGAEFMIGKNISLRGGFDFLRRREMQSTARPRATGFTFGLSIGVKRFRLDYSVMNNHITRATNHLGLSYSFGKKKL